MRGPAKAVRSRPDSPSGTLDEVLVLAAVCAVDGDIRRYFPVDHFYRFYKFILRYFADFVGTAYCFTHVVRPTDELPNTSSVRTWDYSVDVVPSAFYSYPLPSISQSSCCPPPLLQAMVHRSTIRKDRIWPDVY